MNSTQTRNLMKCLNEYFESTVEVTRIKIGKKQTIETLFNEEAYMSHPESIIMEVTYRYSKIFIRVEASTLLGSPLQISARAQEHQTYFQHKTTK